MVGQTYRDPRTGQEFVVVKDFAHRNDGSDLLLPEDAPPDDEVVQHILEVGRPKIPGSGRRITPKLQKE